MGRKNEKSKTRQNAFDRVVQLRDKSGFAWDDGSGGGKKVDRINVF